MAEAMPLRSVTSLYGLSEDRPFRAASGRESPNADSPFDFAQGNDNKKSKGKYRDPSFLRCAETLD